MGGSGWNEGGMWLARIRDTLDVWDELEKL